MSPTGKTTFFVVALLVLLSTTACAGETILLNPGTKGKEVRVSRSEYDKNVAVFAEVAHGVPTREMTVGLYTTSSSGIRHANLLTGTEETVTNFNAWAVKYNAAVRKPNCVKVAIFNDPSQDWSDGTSAQTPLHIDVDTGFLRRFEHSTYAFLIEEGTGKIIPIYPQDYGSSFRWVNWEGLPGFRGYERPELTLHVLVVAVIYPNRKIVLEKYALDLGNTDDQVDLATTFGLPEDGHAWIFGSEIVPYKIGQTVYAKPGLNEATGNAEPWEPAVIEEINNEVIRVRFKTDGRVRPFHWTWFAESVP